ncbi:MAG: metallophosphoesterase family protein [Kiritimatiellae bacterium]|nr:metallophosphoesterase family protein [Kiritimatiellia bacterium]
MNTLRIGWLSDAHYADIPDRGGRSFRASAVKLAEATEHFIRARCDAVIQLGDLKDQDDPPDPTRGAEDLSKAVRILLRYPGPLRHVMGNHELDSLNKAEALMILNDGRPPESAFWELPLGDWTLLGLDACFRPDGRDTEQGHVHWTDATVPASELAWLDRALGAASGPVALFCHQRLDEPEDSRFVVRNAADIRERIERSGRVRVVLQGHHHRSEIQRISGIPYITVPAMTGGPDPADTAFGLLHMTPDGGGRIEILGRAPETCIWGG